MPVLSVHCQVSLTRRTSVGVMLVALTACGGDSAQSGIGVAIAGEVRRHPMAAWLSRHSVGTPSVDPVEDSARVALSEGRPWRATQLLAPRLASPATRTPYTVFLAATAAGEWGGWDRVESLLGKERWLDTLYEGAGRVLLARASLDQTPSSTERDVEAGARAVSHARLALPSAPDAMERGVRLVLLARAFDQSGMSDSARVTYTHSAALLPEAGDWLRLRAAALTSDASARTAIMAALRGDPARTRGAWVEATAREAGGDYAGAVSAWLALGARGRALRARLAAAERSSDTDARQAVRMAAVQLATDRQGAAEGRDAVALLDSAFAPLSPREELVVARALATSGSASRAHAAFTIAERNALAAPVDRHRHGLALARMGRHREAIAQFTRAASDRSIAAESRYQRARSMLRAAQGSAAVAELRRIAREYPEADSSAASALSLLGDLAADSGNDRDARASFRELARRYPASPLARRGLFRAAILAYVAGEMRTAAAEMDFLQRDSTGAESSAALYWAGRAFIRLGDTTVARAHWRSVITRDPASYYAMLARQRLTVPRWVPPARAARIEPVGDIEAALDRAALLERIGLREEAARERDYLERHPDSSLVRLLATADAFLARELANRVIHVAQRALARGAPIDDATYRAMYPLAYREAILAESKLRGLDPGFVAALIRQESYFLPTATSRAGARGLMQVMPAVGRSVATARGFPFWDSALLYQPDVSIQLGTAHLAGLVGKYRSPERILAAYNAGGSRVDRWSRKAGASDAEVFVERIPFVETRDYVRIVLRNRELYRALYGL